MWIDKIEAGVLRILTPLGPRYLQPSMLQRLYLLWLFRHFHTLPHKVLSGRQRRMIDRLCSNREFATWAQPDTVIIGTIESRPPVEAVDQGRAQGEALSPLAIHRQGS
jgi:hypothetical protein